MRFEFLTEFHKIFLIIPIMLSLGIFYFYKKQSHSKKLFILLPVLRSLVIFILFFSCFQPIFIHSEKNTHKPRVAILIDNSKSMRIKDFYPESTTIEIIDQLGILEKDIRSTRFLELQNHFQEIQKKLQLFALNLNQSLRKRHSEKNHFQETYLRIQQKLLQLLSKVDKTLQTQSHIYPKTFQSWKKFKNNITQIALSAKAQSSENNIQFLLAIKTLTKKIKRGKGNLESLQILADYELSQSHLPQVKKALKMLQTKTRFELTAQLLKNNSTFMQNLKKHFDVDLYSLSSSHAQTYTNIFANSANLDYTNLGSATRNIIRSYGQTPPVAFMLLSDGHNNAGYSLQKAANFLKKRDILLISSGVGSEEKNKDIIIKKVLSEITEKDHLIHIKAIISTYGFADRAIKIELKKNNKILDSKIIHLKKGTTESEVFFQFKEKNYGHINYSIFAEKLQNEATHENNQKNISIFLLKEPFKVLLIDLFPRWESRFIDLTLKRNNRIKLDTLYLHSYDSRADYAHILSTDNLQQMNVIILGDVSPNSFTEKNIEDFINFVSQGGTLILNSGHNFMPKEFLNSKLSKLLPIQSFFKQNKKNWKYPKQNILLATGSKNSFLLKTLQYFNLKTQNFLSLPPPSYIFESQLNSEVIATYKNTNNPFISWKGYNKGKTLFINTDSTWNWRIADGFHFRFWNEVINWAATKRLLNSTADISLSSNKDIFFPDEPIIITAKLSKNQQPLLNSTANLEIFNSSGQLIRKAPLSATKTPGIYRCILTKLPKNQYRISINPSNLTEKSQDFSPSIIIKVDLFPSNELEQSTLNSDILKNISRKYLPFYKLKNIIKSLPSQRIETNHQKQTDIIKTLPFFFIITLLLTIEWLIRKLLNYDF